jgi:hypothetical protein
MEVKMKSKTSSCLVTVALLGAGFAMFAWPSEAQAKPRQRRTVVADSGVLALGPDQVLRLTLSSTAKSGLSLRFRRLQYDETGCDQGACQLNVAAYSLTDPLSVAAGQAVSVEIRGGSAGVRVMAVTLENALISSYSFRANGDIRDANTNQIIAILIGLLAPSRPRGAAPPLFDVTDPFE